MLLAILAVGTATVADAASTKADRASVYNLFIRLNLKIVNKISEIESL